MQPTAQSNGLFLHPAIVVLTGRIIEPVGCKDENPFVLSDNISQRLPVSIGVVIELSLLSLLINVHVWFLPEIGVITDNFHHHYEET